MPSSSPDPATQLSIILATALGLLFWTALIVWLWDTTAAPVYLNSI